MSTHNPDIVSAAWASQAKSARERLSSASFELWNARLETLRMAGNLRAIQDHLASPVELAGDNCSCNTGCNVCFELRETLAASNPGAD